MLVSLAKNWPKGTKDTRQYIQPLAEAEVVVSQKSVTLAENELNRP
jgi:hypothetical protein